MKQLGLIGYPLSHSFSSGYFKEKFEELNCSQYYSYQNFELSEIKQLPDLIHSNPSLIGLNVTIPYKRDVIPLLHELTPAASTIEAVNTILIERKDRNKVKLIGDNTDWIGFQQSLINFLKGSKPNGALILGSGGSSAAVRYVLNKLQIKFLTVSRTPDAQKTKSIGYGSLTSELIRNKQLIINTTPLGMFPNTDNCPEIPYADIQTGHFLYDLIYNPEETLFLRKGRNNGAQTKNGLEMLKLQADASWSVWTRSR